MGQHLRAERIDESGRRVVVLAGELDIATAELAEQAMAEPFDVLDLSGLEFMDSIGIRALARTCPAGLQVRGARPMIRRILDLAGVCDKFVFIDAVADQRSASS